MLSVLFWSVWRRLYGEGLFKEYCNRTLQTLVAIIVLILQLAEWNWQAVLIALGVSVWVVIEYWSRAVGEIIDAGLNHTQTKKSYNRWFRVPLDCVYDLMGFKKYVGFYDFWYSLIRYGIGALPVFYYSWVAVFLIPFQYFIYLGCHKVYFRYPQLFGLPLTLNEPKNAAEIIHGALFGLIMGILK